jgi:hypothetical protein
MTMRATLGTWTGVRAVIAVLMLLGTVGIIVPLIPVASARSHGGDHDRDFSRRGEDFHWSGRVGRGRVIEIKGVNGRIVAEPTSGDQVIVSAERRARRSDPMSVRIEVIEHEDGVTICAVYPGRRGEPNTCEAGASSHTHVDDNDVVVDFAVRVPAGVRLSARTVNGGIEAGDLDGPIEAHTVNGSVRLSTRDQASAETVNGSIVAEVGSASWSGALEFSTVNGGITLALPENVVARLKAETLNGDISSDFPFTVSDVHRSDRNGWRGVLSKRKIVGTIGDGSSGGALELSTVNGSIRLRASS